MLQANPSAAFEPTIYRPFKSPNRDKSNHATNRLTAVPLGGPYCGRVHLGLVWAAAVGSLAGKVIGADAGVMVAAVAQIEQTGLRWSRLKT